MRPILHRASLVEMAVPYGDVNEPFQRKCAFDVGDYGLGFCANSLELGCDCLGHIQYFDGLLNTTQGACWLGPFHESSRCGCWSCNEGPLYSNDLLSACLKPSVQGHKLCEAGSLGSLGWRRTDSCSKRADGIRGPQLAFPLSLVILLSYSMAVIIPHAGISCLACSPSAAVWPSERS